MSRVILTTCGTSLFTSNCWKESELSKDQALSQASLDDRPELERKYRMYTSGHREKDPDGNSLAAQFDKDNIWEESSQIAKLPAELASLRVIIEALNSKDNQLKEKDKIILLHSDNDDGKFCAKVIQKILGKLLPDVKIESDEVKGLDPVSAQQLVDALKNIWSKYYLILNSNSNTKFIFNLTGGYKATSMILTALSGLFALSSESSNMPDITITYLHESTPHDNLFSIYWNRETSILNAIQFGFGTRDNYGEIAGSL